ncbi:MAG: hypothetical protein ACPGU1_12795 [Myxococcota bacterium]
MIRTPIALRLLTLLTIAGLGLVAPACGSSDTGVGGTSDIAASGDNDAVGGATTGDTTGATGTDPGDDDDAAGPDDTGEAEPEGDAPTCTADCEGKTCGDDGCGGSCGECAEGEGCGDDGTCAAAECAPNCDGVTCGDDGCGGSCGECAEGEACGDDGACVAAGDDPCNPNPCDSPPADNCEGDTPVVYDAMGECIYIGDTVSCSYSFTEGEPCGEDLFCSNGACIEGGIPSEFGSDSSLINEMLIAAANEPEDCCFDFDGDGQIDNGVGGLLSSLGSFLGDVDVDGSLADAIADGSISIVLEGLGVDDLVNDDQVDVKGYVAYFDDAGDLLVQPGSFNEDGTPLVHFVDGEIVDGVAHMGPADFETSLPLAGMTLNLAVKDARGQTAISASDDGSNFDMTDGRLGGLLPFGDIVSTLNMAASACECLDLNGGDMFDLKSEDSMGCSSAFNSANPNCNDSDGSLCTGLAGIADQKFLVCNIGLGLIKPDIDTDFNGKGDHFSLGLRFSGEATPIAGIGEDQSLDGCGDCSGGGSPLNGLAHLALFAMCFAFVTRKRRA